jgi:hypothetical protein
MWFVEPGVTFVVKDVSAARGAGLGKHITDVRGARPAGSCGIDAPKKGNGINGFDCAR